MTQSVYPIALDLSGKRCLVVGGGSIATEKVEGLIGSGACVVVVSSAITPRIEALAAANKISLHRRPYQPDDLIGAFLVIAASDQMEVNARVAKDARAIGVLVNAVDDPPNCDFYAMSIVRRGDLQIAISTNGRSPAFARWMRERLEALIPAEYEELLAVLAEVRQTLKTEGSIPPYAHWQTAIDDQLLERLQRGDRVGARAQLEERVRGAPSGASVPSRVRGG
jgi:precorrin-2 dehydrogenase/sirohydrochlorin ferrochelatase